MSLRLRLGAAPGAYRYSKARLAELLTLDASRANELLETVQYSLLFGALGLLVGHAVNACFPRLDKAAAPSRWRVAAEALAQGALVAVLALYVRKLVHVVPMLAVVRGPSSGSAGGPFRPYQSAEFDGDIALSVMFVASQTRLLDKVAWLAG
jgi:hypothetical protein